MVPASPWVWVVMEKTVFWLIITSASGITLTTSNVSIPQKYGTMMLSFFVTGTISRASARYFSSRGGIDSIGFTVTFSADTAFIFLTARVSPIAEPVLYLARPSTLMILCPSSVG